MCKEEMSREDIYTLFLDWRGIETDCSKCGGSGLRVYPSTATWHGGIGGQALTRDVCDNCWGSGDETHKWANLRMLFNKLKYLEHTIDTLQDNQK